MQGVSMATDFKKALSSFASGLFICIICLSETPDAAPDKHKLQVFAIL